MVEVLEFIFRNFWTWLGITIMLWIVFGGVGRGVSAILLAITKKK